MFRRSRADRHLDRVFRLARDHARQVEFIVDQSRWRKPERRILGDLLDRHPELREQLEAFELSTEAELRSVLAGRRRARALIPEDAWGELAAERARLTAAVLAETDDLIGRLRALPPPAEVEAGMAGFYAAYDEWHSDAVVEAWLSAKAAADAAEHLLEAAS